MERTGGGRLQAMTLRHWQWVRRAARGMVLEAAYGRSCFGDMMSEFDGWMTVFRINGEMPVMPARSLSLE